MDLFDRYTCINLLINPQKVGIDCERNFRARTNTRIRMEKLKCILSIILISFVIFGCNITLCTGQGPVINVQAVAHKKALLPCDINPPVPSDQTILVLWYKDSMDMPIYSFDSRAKPTTHAKNEALLGTRAYFRVVTEPATLSIDNLSEKDQGLYKCRVDFIKSPTRYQSINLSVIIPPQKPTIFAESGRELTNGISGPHREGESMTLTCVAASGRPPPKVTWWKENALLDDTFKVITSDGAVQNKMTSSPLTRADLLTIFTCQASNNNMSEPVTTSVQVEMFFKPLDVKILGSNQPLSALQEIEIVCQSFGSRPSAEINFYKDGQHLKTYREEVSTNGNMTTAILKLTPRVGDHGKSLVCRAENSKLDASALEDSWKLQVFFVPILQLSLGSNLDAKNIKEMDDVYFECKINANPWVYKVIWLHNGMVVQHNASAGIIMSNQSLVLQKVRRASGGMYVCTATNIEGEGRSNPVELSIMYKPICKSEQKRVYGVAKGEQVEIECRVDSNPPSDNFRWSFNNSGESLDLPQQTRYSNANSAKTSSSILSYTPMTEHDYGTLLCIASNDIGKMSEPCFYVILAAGRPDAPINCSVHNITSDSMEVDCIESFDGGLPQVFVAEIVDAESPKLLSNLTSPIPFFIISGLKPGQALRLFIYAANRKGISDKVFLEGQTIQEAEMKRTAASQAELELTPILGICVGVVCGLLVVALAIVLALKFRTDARPPSLKATKTEYRVDDSNGEDKNPDIIPSSKENEYFYPEGLTTTFNGPTKSSNGSITENFRNCTYYSDKQNAEVTYAELNLENNGGMRGGNGNTSWSNSTIDRKRRRVPNLIEDPTTHPGSGAVIYATIDHCRRTNGDIPSHIPPNQLQQLQQLQQQQQQHQYQQQREVISVKTPLLVNSQQESCV